MSNKIKQRILNLEPKGYSFEALNILMSFGHVDEGPLDRSTLLKRVKNYDILIVRLGHQIDAKVLKSGVRLKYIVTATTGLNHIDLNSAHKQGVRVLSLRGERDFLNNVHATAEHTWALLTALIRRIPMAHSHVLAGGWDRDLFRGYELNGRILGIIGLGRLGSKVARYGLAFGMNVLCYDENDDVKIPEGVERVDLERVLNASNVICLHVNYKVENRGLIGKNQFAAMKKGALFVNTSRGELVDEQALLQGLSSGHLGGAALDVLCGENEGWKISQPLFDYARTHNNLIITPHIGGCTFESMDKTEVYMAQRLKNIIIQTNK